MDNQAIEQTALHAVQDRVNLTKYLSSYLDSNDKTPSWDGFIYIYKTDKKTNDNQRGRLPAQIKGHESKDFSKDTISYNIELAHLRNYLNDGGAILFVVYVTPNDDQTDFLKKVYYTELTPVKLSSLISECPIIQNTKTIHLKAVPKNADDFASIVLNCYLNCKRQTSFAGARLQTVEELQEKGVLESIQFFVSGFGDDYKGPRGFLKSDTPLYARIKGSAIPQPLRYEGEILEKTIAYDVDHAVSCDNVVFRNKYRVTATNEKSTIHLGYGITLTFERNKDGCQFNYKASHKLREFVSDAPFMLAFAKTKCFMIGDIPLDFSGCEFNTGNYNLVEHEADYQRLSRYVEMLDKQGCIDDLDYTVLTPEDWRNLERLTQATLDGKPVYGLSNDLSSIVAINVGNLKFAVGLTHCEEEGVYSLCHVQDCKDVIWCSPDQSEIIPVPIVAIFKPEDYTTLSNIHFDDILPSIQSFPINAHTCAVANQIMLNMVLASDIAESKRKKILLKTALSIAEWLASMPDTVWEKSIATLNKLQIIIRQRPLGEEERAILHVMTMMPNTREDIVFAALALLGKKDEALKHFSNLPVEAQNELKEYPIYYFIAS